MEYPLIAIIAALAGAGGVGYFVYRRRKAKKKPIQPPV